MMPTALARTCILAGCPKGGTVLDPYAGTGTSGIIAAEQGCNFVGIELNPKSHAIAQARVAAAYGQQRMF
jgi:DNA modification methylase